MNSNQVRPADGAAAVAEARVVVTILDLGKGSGTFVAGGGIRLEHDLARRDGLALVGHDARNVIEPFAAAPGKHSGQRKSQDGRRNSNSNHAINVAARRVSRR